MKIIKLGRRRERKRKRMMFHIGDEPLQKIKNKKIKASRFLLSVL